MTLNPIKWPIKVNHDRRDQDLLWGFPLSRTLISGHSSFTPVWFNALRHSISIDIFMYVVLLVIHVLGFVQVIWAWKKLLNNFCLFLQYLSLTRSPAFVFKWPCRSYITDYLSIVPISVMLSSIT